MNKFFLKETGEEIKFGDELVLNMEKDTEHKKLYKELTVEFSPLLAPLLLEEGIIESKDVNDAPSNKECSDCIIESILETQEALEKKIDEMEDTIIDLKL
jgi:hypothetical protein